MTKKFKIINFCVLCILLTSCSKKSNEPKKTRIFDAEGNIIAEIEKDVALPEEYAKYLERVIQETISKTKIDPYQTVLDIHTNLDTAVQKALNNRIAENNDPSDKAIIVKENATGNAVAYHNESFTMVEHKTTAKDGSGKMIETYNSVFDYQMISLPLMLPLLTYALAFDCLGTSTADSVLDEIYIYKGTDYVAPPKELPYRGVISLQDAFNSGSVGSLRIGLAIINNIGKTGTADYLKLFVSGEPPVSTNSELQFFHQNSFHGNVETISNGYQMILNEGNYNETRFIDRIVSISDSQEIDLQYKNSAPLSKQASYLVTEMLRGSFKDSEYLSSVASKNSDRSLYGYAETSTVFPKSIAMDHIPNDRLNTFGSVVGNASYSITFFSVFSDPVTTKAVSDGMQSTISDILVELNKKPFQIGEIQRPEGIEETNYAPGILTDRGIDAHSENLSEVPNPGLRKR